MLLYQVSAYSISDVGLVRQNNEDSCRLLKDEQFYVLADGMGGHRAGEIASREAVDRLCSLFQERVTARCREEISEAEELLRSLVQEVNFTVFQLSKTQPNWRGMGTTLCCAFIQSKGLVYMHVGDSRIYHYQGGVLHQLTQDHSLLRELIDLGRITEQQSVDFVYKNVITKAIGTEPFLEPSIGHIPIATGDVIMMCTDGLTDLISFDEIRQALGEYSIEKAGEWFVARAKQKGAHDNITVVLVKIEDKYEANLS